MEKRYRNKIIIIIIIIIIILYFCFLSHLFQPNSSILSSLENDLSSLLYHMHLWCDETFHIPQSIKVPGVIVSALGLVGPVSVYCDWVR